MGREISFGSTSTAVLLAYTSGFASLAVPIVAVSALAVFARSSPQQVHA